MAGNLQGLEMRIPLATTARNGLLDGETMLYERWQKVVRERQNEIALRDLASGRCWTFLELAAEAWHSAFDVHVHAVFHLCRAAIPAMRRKKQGVVILISSAAGIRCPCGRWG